MRLGHPLGCGSLLKALEETGLRWIQDRGPGAIQGRVRTGRFPSNRASLAGGVSPTHELGLSLRQFLSIPTASGVLRWLGIRPEGAT
jgi:hypothetical protein